MGQFWSSKQNILITCLNCCSIVPWTKKSQKAFSSAWIIFIRAKYFGNWSLWVPITSYNRWNLIQNVYGHRIIWYFHQGWKCTWGTWNQIQIRRRFWKKTCYQDWIFRWGFKNLWKNFEYLIQQQNNRNTTISGLHSRKAVRRNSRTYRFVLSFHCQASTYLYSDSHKK